MRRRTERENAVLGKVELIMRNLSIRKDTRAYGHLVDIITYAYVHKDEDIIDIANFLQKENFYVGVCLGEVYSEKNAVNKIWPALIRTIETAIEHANDRYLQELGLDKLKIILDDHSAEELIAEIGEKYIKYAHDEQILVYFVKKILKNL